MLRKLHNAVLDRIKEMHDEEGQKIESLKFKDPGEEAIEKILEDEGPKEPKLTGKAKLMRDIAQSKDMKKLERSKDKLTEIEYRYLKDLIDLSNEENA